MNEYLLSALLGCLTGVAGTGAGGLLSAVLPVGRSRLPSLLMGFSGGIMLAIVACAMAPEAFELAPVHWVFLFAVLGAAAVELLHRAFPHGGHGHAQAAPGNGKFSAVARTGLLLCMGVAIHNLPDGLAIGAGVERPDDFGLNLAILLLIHNIPEGLAMGIPLRLGGAKWWQIGLITVASGLPKVIGAVIGTLAGNISEALIGFIIAFAAGAMLYLTLRELIPEAARLHSPLSAVAAVLVGAAVGVCAVVLL